MFARRIRYCLLAVVASILSGFYGEKRATFSLPDSMLLFAKPYYELHLVTADRLKVLPPPVNVSYNSALFNYPSISPRSDLLAWGFAVADDPHMQHGVRFALGLYLIAEQKWRMYGAFDDIGATAFSPDGSKIAFAAEQSDRKDAFLIFDIATEKITNIPHPKGIPERASLGWSPDGKRLVVETQRLGKSSLINVLNPDTGDVQPIGEGTQPSWSPTGEWIAYFDFALEKCILTHPDGTGTKTVGKAHNSFFTSSGYGYSIVWSPNGKKLLLNESRGEYGAIDVWLVDIETGRSIMKSKNGLAVFGWAACGK